jgi:DNA-binding response OmpR family regulator
MTEETPARDHGGLSAAAGPILVVDDDTQLQRTIQWLLEDEGLTVETASNGEEALARAKRRRPALVILDLNLPALDGEGVVQGLRASNGSGVPILVISSDGQVEERAQEVGAYGWLSKPFEIEDLVTAVWQALATD